MGKRKPHRTELQSLERARAEAVRVGVPRSLLSALERLEAGQLQTLDEFMWRLLNLKYADDEPDPPIAKGREVVRRIGDGHSVYRLERVRCGKDRCRCANGGPLHGPYWYAYQRKAGKMTSRYIGKKAPGVVNRRRAAEKRMRPSSKGLNATRR